MILLRALTRGIDVLNITLLREASANDQRWYLEHTRFPYHARSGVHSHTTMQVVNRTMNSYLIQFEPLLPFTVSFPSGTSPRDGEYLSNI